MSRIIHGHSDEVKSVIMKNPHAEAQIFQGKRFRNIQVEGTYTQQELEADKKQSFAEGKDTGAKEAAAKVLKPLNAALENVESLVTALNSFKNELYKEAESQVIEMVRVVCKKIVGREVALEAGVIENIVHRGLEILEKQRRVAIQMNPADQELFTKAKPDFLNKLKGLEHLDFTFDPNLERKEVKLQTEQCEIDTNISEMVDQLLAQVTTGGAAAKDPNSDEDSV